MCRFCFEGDEEGELISPCNCAGGQKFVHLKCLRQWQRMTLASQPTHPAFYSRDVRHQTCNVCKAVFTCPPPTRHELMASFTGPEIAALIEARCIIASTEEFSLNLSQSLEENPMLNFIGGCRHWIYSVLLITSVTAEVVLGEPSDCGTDHVCAVNLTRPLSEPRMPRVVHDAVRRVCKKPGFRGASHVELSHYIGGPCDEGRLVSCLVLGGGGCGWTLVSSLEQAIELAHSRATHRSEAEGDVCGGQTVRLAGLQGAPELNGEIGIALRFNDQNGRWLVRLRNGEGKQLKPSNLEAQEGQTGRVLCFWGDARWSRTQLLGEIARGSWGLCRANVGDLATAHDERWRNTHGRLAMAPKNVMTEDYMRTAHGEMIRARARREMQQQEAPDDDDTF